MLNRYLDSDYNWWQWQQLLPKASILRLRFQMSQLICPPVPAAHSLVILPTQSVCETLPHCRNAHYHYHYQQCPDNIWIFRQPICGSEFQLLCLAALSSDLTYSQFAKHCITTLTMLMTQDLRLLQEEKRSKQPEIRSSATVTQEWGQGWQWS